MTTGILETWQKEPGEKQDYDVDFTKYIRSMGETVGAAHSLSVSADTGITVTASSITDGVAKIWLQGGTDGEDYQVTAIVTTAGGRIHHGHILIQVRLTNVTP
jgi:hypothetical protein